MQNLNYLLNNFQLSGSGTAWQTPEIEVDTDSNEVFFDVCIEAVEGSPSAATLAIKFQLAPIDYDGLNINTDSTSGRERPFVDVVASDGYTGHLLIDGAWPADSMNGLAVNGAAIYRTVSRRLRVPPNCRVARLEMTPTFTGGTSPAIRVTVATGIADS